MSYPNQSVKMSIQSYTLSKNLFIRCLMPFQYFFHCSTTFKRFVNWCYKKFTCKYVISAICMSRMAGMPYLNFLCIVLWCQTFIPIHAPILPPRTANNKSVASEMRHLAFLALYLSMPYTMKATALMARK